MTNTVWWNEGVQTLFGYSTDEVGSDAKWWSEQIHPEDRERVVSGIYAVIDAGGHTWSDEYRRRYGNGAYALVIDRGYVARIAQMLRGAVGNIGAQAIWAAASQLERSGRPGDRAQAAAASATLETDETELERLVPVLIAPTKEVVL